MKQPIPSRQALQYLTRICQSFESTPRSAINHHIHPSRNFSTHIRRAPFHPSITTTPPSQTRDLSTTLPRPVQPSPNPDTDPQNTSTATLPDITNYYTLFPSTLPTGAPGPPPPEQSSSRPSSAQFNIHLPTLRKEFLRLQSMHHPDKYSTGSTAHQKAVALSALINNAYKTLSDPLLRAQYLLQLQYGIDVMSEDNAAHPTDQETLMEVMEAQERVEGVQDEGVIEEVKGENRRRMVETELRMGEAFEKGDVEVAKNECVRLKYWRSLQSGLDEWEPGKEVRLVH